jgi:hypothetical protein
MHHCSNASPYEKFLGKYFDHQSQVGCQSTAQLAFAKCQGTKTSFSSMLPRIYTMAIFANLKYFGKEQASNLDAKKCTKDVSKDSHQLA